MRFRYAVLAPLVAGVLSAPLASNNASSSNSTEPCNIITQAAIQFYSNSSNAKLPYSFQPSLAYACLESSTIDNQLASIYATEVRKYVEFQSNIAYFKNPPSDYPYAPVDLLGGLDDIASKAALGGFPSQYEFDLAIQRLVYSTHEGHFSLPTCTLEALAFRRGLPSVQLVSVSKDGLSLPLIYLLSDFIAGQSNLSVSNVKSINGQEAVAFLQDYATANIPSDPDSAYNYLFTSYGRAPSQGSFNGAFAILNVYQYPGDYTNLTFANGTFLPFQNYAYLNPRIWSDTIVDGESFTQHFCIEPAQQSPPTSASNATTTSTPTAPTGTTAPTLLGYPYYPVAKDPNNQIAGYFLNGTGYQDTAVFYIPSFLNETAPLLEAPVTFQNTTRDFFAAARAANKTKLIIDVSGNGGGNAILPNDIFKRLFPSIDPYGASRLRVPPAANIFGSVLAQIPPSLLNPSPSDNFTTSAEKDNILSDAWYYPTYLDSRLQNFTGWSNGSNPLFGPFINNGDNVTALIRSPLNSTSFDEIIDDVVPYGYGGSDEVLLPQPFEVENIILLTDGFCASACSIFAEFLTRQGNVKTVTIGGLPRYKPMQAIGGTKGSQVTYFSFLQANSLLLFDPQFQPLIPDDLVPTLNDTLPGLMPLPLGENDMAALSGYGMNFRDNIALGDENGIPLQFVQEPSNCRLFFTAKSVSNPLSLWEQVADVAWGGGACAVGSLEGVRGNGTSVNGGNGTNGNGTSGGGSGRYNPNNGAVGVSLGGGVKVVAAFVVVLVALF